MNTIPPGLFFILVINASVVACSEQTTHTPLSDTGTVTNSAQLVRLATLPLGAELTGLFVNTPGDLFFNVQHPSRDNPPPFDRAAIGVVDNLNIH
ncbi:MAG: hypothetical protein OEX19_01785, partial [Gammaproteobacteria bacterium]|nr:hypothetical protein [Gammaproteobacteria bacterium]